MRSSSLWLFLVAPLLISCGDSLGDSVYEVKNVNMDGQKFQFIRVTWGIAANHTSVAMVQQLGDATADTLLFQKENNLIFFRVHQDSLSIYTMDSSGLRTARLQALHVHVKVTDNKYMMNMLDGEAYKKYGLTRL